MIFHKRRGSILILTLFILIVMQLLGMAFLTRVQGEMAQTTRDVTSMYVVTSALADTRAWMENRSNANLLDNSILALPSGVDPDEPASMSTYYERTAAQNNIPTPSGWTWRARLYPDPFTNGNSNIQGSNMVHCYKIVIDAIDTHSGVGGAQLVRRRAVAWLRQAGFADNNYMYGSSPPTQTRNGPSYLWFDLSTFKIEGKFHTNDYLRLSVPNGYDWDDTANAAFGSEATFSKASTKSLDRIIYGAGGGSTGEDPNPPSDQNYLPYNKSNGLPVPLDSDPSKNRYDRLGKLGQGGFKLQNTVNIPDISQQLQDAAWGSTTMPTNLQAGININPGPAAGTLTAGGTSVPIQKNINGVILTGANSNNDIQAMQLQVGNDAQYPINDTSLRGANNDNSSILIRQSTGSSSTVTRRLTQTYSETTLAPTGNWKVNGITVNGPMVIPPGYTIVQNDTSQKTYSIYQDQSNGLFYSPNLNINSLEGINKGRRTIAVNHMANPGKEIQISGDLIRADVTPGSPVPLGTTRDQLGVIGYAIRFSKERTDAITGNKTNVDRSQWTTSNPMYLYTALFAGRPNDPNANSNTKGGGVGTVDYSNGDGGLFRLYGSLTENVRQAKGTFGNGSTGMSYQYQYDDNYKTVQPPYFPAQSIFDVVSWNDRPLSEDAATP